MIIIVVAIILSKEKNKLPFKKNEQRFNLCLFVRLPPLPSSSSSSSSAFFATDASASASTGTDRVLLVYGTSFWPYRVLSLVFFALDARREESLSSSHVCFVEDDDDDSHHHSYSHHDISPLVID